MSFDVAAEAYDGFMGRYSRLLARQMADLAGVESGRRVLDVGCGPGALTAELVHRVGAANVSAADPSASFVAAIRTRFPGVDVRDASAEELPFADGAFDASIAQLVVHFMADPVAGLHEMARVTRPGGVVAACVWDHAGGKTPVSSFWEAAHELDPAARDESALAGARQGHLLDLFAAAGIGNAMESVISADLEQATFDGWWQPFTQGVGPAGAYLGGLDQEHRDELRAACRRRIPNEPFVIQARAWAARGNVREVQP